jgi:glycosyltransferase involved in cell wall biosynthesis
MARTSVIISLSEAAAQNLPLLLVSLSAQTDRHFEVLIADAGSNPAHAALVQRWQKEVSYTLHYVTPPDWAHTAAAARNRAASESWGDYLVFLDDDCVVARDFIRQHRRMAEGSWFVTSSPVMMGEALAERVRQQALPIWNWPRRTWMGLMLRGQCKGGSLLLPLQIAHDSPWRKQQPQRIKDIPDSHLAVWRRDFVVVGGYDEGFEGSAYSNRELALRLLRTGVQRKDGDLSCRLFAWPATEPTVEKAITLNRNYTMLQETMLANRIVARHALATRPATQLAS